MFANVKKKIKKIIRKRKLGERYSSDTYISYLKEKGVIIGKQTIIFDPINTVIDITTPKMLSIGENVRITSGCKILTHDFSHSVLARTTGECFGGIGIVEIGNNVFIGVNTVILKNTIIEDNVIIGACSLVKGHLEANSVYAGNPARKIMSLTEYYEKLKNNTENDILRIASRIDLNDKNEVWRYLEEYSNEFIDGPNVLKQKRMKDTGYEKECFSFYEKYTPKYTIESIKQMMISQNKNNH